MKTKKLKHEPIKEYFPEIRPTKSVVPRWYKTSPKHIGDKPTFLPTKNNTLKMCTPFLDAMTSGYVITLAGDLIISKSEDGSVNITWGRDDLLVSRDMASLGHLPIPDGYEKEHFAWINPTTLTIPRGYSMLLTHPLNRYELPFLTLSGIVDDFEMHSGFVPFFLKKDFEGILPQGTPIAQLILFKRDNWKLEREEGLSKRAQMNAARGLLVQSGWYRKFIWKKKNYN